MIRKGIPYGKQWIDSKDIRAVISVLHSDWITQGPKILAFEDAIAKYTNAQYAVAVSSGTAALHLAYLAANLKAGDEVITTPLTFAATSNMILHVGAKPVFADVDADTLTINPESIQRAITKKTKALAVVDFAGHPCDYDAITGIAKKHNLIVIEDAAHALGSEYRGRKLGSIADMTILSFHPLKTITTGEGGMVLTNNKKYYEKLILLRHHGIIKKPQYGGWYYEIEEPGFNYRLTDIQCALGLSQLKKLPAFIKKRREIVARYNKAFATIPELITPQEQSWAMSAWHLYVMQLDLKRLRVNRKKIFDELYRQGIGTQVHYMPLHLQPLYQNMFGYKPGNFPEAEHYYHQALSLPLFSSMTKEQIQRVIATLTSIIKKNRL